MGELIGIPADQHWAWMLIATVVAGIIGYVFRWHQEDRTLGTAAKRRDEIIENAKKDAELKKREALVDGKAELQKLREKTDQEISNKRSQLKRYEDKLHSRDEDLKQKQSDLAKRVEEVEERNNALDAERDALKAEEERLKRKLEETAGLTVEESKAQLIQMIEDEARSEAAHHIRRIEQEAEATADEKAQKILTTAIERYASDITAERTVTSVALPSDDLKGRIIGREGRNIREFERVSGVDLIIDDTPGAVTLSCFDPVRREVARMALAKLVSDGRIHPSRIEEVLNKARKEVDQIIRKSADEVTYELGIHNLRAEILQVLGRLKFRTSYGQNILAHSLEVARIGSLIAAEMGMNINTVKRACLLHDIGKAVDHEVEGPHAMVGADLIKRYGEPPAVVAAVAGHHGDIEQTLEAVLVQLADAISASRPGVRMESSELYIKRLEAIEEIATTKPGVTKAYAVQAGREVRVFVNHDKIDDKGAKKLAKEIAKQIESELNFPGQIRITVIRETKFTEYAR